MTDDKKQTVTKAQEISDRRAAFFSLFQVVKSRSLYILLLTSLAVAGTMIGHFNQDTRFTATSTLFVQPIDEPTAAEYLLNQHVGRAAKSERIETYMRYLSSDTFFISAAQKLKYHPDYEKLDFQAPTSYSPISLLFWKKLLFFNSYNQKQTQQSKLNADDLAGYIKQITTYDSDYSHFIHIRSTALSPQNAQIVANIIAEEFVDLTNQRGLQEIEQVQEFIKKKLKETEERLKTTELELIEFKKKNSIISTDTSSSLLADRYTKIASELETAKLQYEENQKLLSYFENGQKANLDSLSQVPANGGIGTKETALILQRKLEQLKKQRSVIIAQENQGWKLQEIDSEINKTAQAFKHYASKATNENIFNYMNPQRIQQKINELKEENQILKTKISTHNKAMGDVQAQVGNIPSLAQKQFVLENGLKLETENYTNMKNKLMELEIQRISHKKEIRVDQVSGAPSALPKGSLVLKIIFSLLASLIFGIGVFVLIEAIDPSIKHRADLNDCGVEFIGDIPLIERQENDRNKNLSDSQNLVCLHNPESIDAMAFKYIRARIESMRYKLNKQHQIISISSSHTHEGKSFISANLAVSLSQLKRKTLLIDCDLRRPTQNSYFEVTPQYGLVDLLDMKKRLDEVVIPSVQPFLDYIPAGFCTQNSSEYIASEKFRAFIAYIKDQYDYIVIDTPPVRAAVDATVISSFSDIPILVACFRETKKHELHETYNQYLQVSYKRVFGIINKAIISTMRFHYYGYHSYSQDEKANISSLSSSLENSSDIQKFLDTLKAKSS